MSGADDRQDDRLWAFQPARSPGAGERRARAFPPPPTRRMMRSIDEPVDRAGLRSTNPRGRSGSDRRRVAIPREEHSKAQAPRDLVLLVARSRASLSGPTAVRSAVGSETPAVVY